MAEEKFINPYNFIQFPHAKAKAYTDEDRHTGVIEYRITTKTPLFIPNSSSETAFIESNQVKDHKSYDFFSYTDLNAKDKCEGVFHVPVISGSEIRGVIRSVYETLTDSCMGMLNEKEYPVKRTSELFNPALIMRQASGEMTLYKAKSYRVGSRAKAGKMPQGFESYRNGTLISYNKPLSNGGRGIPPITEYSAQKNKYSSKGYLLKWGMGVKKARYHLYVPTNEVVKGIRISKDVVERTLLNVINSYLNQSAVTKENKKAYEDYKEDLERFLRGQSGQYFPVNYSTMKNGILYLSPAVYSKEVANQNLGSLAGEFAPCKKELCPACNLFGYVQTDGDRSCGSKVRFTDLYVEDINNAKEYYACNKITLQALGEPKLGNVDFYLEKPEGADFWTYDYYVKGGKEILASGKLRGRKYYWHHQNVALPTNVEATNLNKTIRPVKEGIVFKGKLYFENISNRQLNQLIWILNSGKENLGFKIGAGKPLGLGSIICNVDRVAERTISLSEGHLEYAVHELPQTVFTYDDVGFSNSVKEEFYKMAGLHSIPTNMEITYPKCRSQKEQVLTEGYKWFVENHRTMRMPRKRVDMRIGHELPHILDRDLGLPYLSDKKNRMNDAGKRGKR